MISVKVDEANRVLMVEMVGTVSEADIEAAADTLQREYPGVGVHLRGEGAPFFVLSDWQRLDGWEKGAKTFGTVLNKAIGDGAKKLAVVADDRFLDEQPRLADVLSNAAVRFFPSGDTEQALAWLRDN
jgi:hypothetical protein